MTSPTRPTRPARTDVRSRGAAVLVAIASLLAVMLAVVLLVERADAGPDEHDDDGATPAATSDETGADSFGEDDDQRRELREQVEEKLREARRNFMKEHVELDDATADALDALLETHHRAQYELHGEVRRSRRALASAIEDESTDDETFVRLEREHLDAIRALDAKRLEIFEQTREVLTDAQQARLLIALPAFERKVKRHIRRARGEGKGKGKRGGGRRGGYKKFK